MSVEPCSNDEMLLSDNRLTLDLCCLCTLRWENQQKKTDFVIITDLKPLLLFFYQDQVVDASETKAFPLKAWSLSMEQYISTWKHLMTVLEMFPFHYWGQLTLCIICVRKELVAISSTYGLDKRTRSCTRLPVWAKPWSVKGIQAQLVRFNLDFTTNLSFL